MFWLFLNQSVGVAGEGHRKDSPFKDQSDEQGWDAPDGRLIQNHGQTPHGPQTTDQGHMEGDQDLWRQPWILQESAKSLLPSLRSCSQGKAPSQSGLREPTIGPPGSAKQSQ